MHSSTVAVYGSYPLPKKDVTKEVDVFGPDLPVKQTDDAEKVELRRQNVLLPQEPSALKVENKLEQKVQEEAAKKREQEEKDRESTDSKIAQVYTGCCLVGIVSIIYLIGSMINDSKK